MNKRVSYKKLLTARRAQGGGVGWGGGDGILVSRLQTIVLLSEAAVRMKENEKKTTPCNHLLSAFVSALQSPARLPFFNRRTQFNPLLIVFIFFK